MDARAGGHRRLGLACNLLLRAVVIGFTVEAVLATGDPRFEGKGIAVRNLVLAGAALTLAVPVVQAVWRPWRRYPVWTEAVVLSILALDMAFNSFDLYEQGLRLDLIPHTYGPAAGLAALRMVGTGTLPAMLIANGAHLLLEVQEAIGDAVFGTHNVHGWWDTVTDLGAGLAGSAVVALSWDRLRARLGGPRHGRSHRSYSAA